ncbi:MAG: hypothetical protein U9N50_03690, partial [Pseudomonadota bacterium]|nr:hypothetical protein [Pseudomonadota bacterium]
MTGPIHQSIAIYDKLYCQKVGQVTIAKQMANLESNVLILPKYCWASCFSPTYGGNFVGWVERCEA